MIHAFSISLPAVLLAALSGFFIGGIWYGPLFRKPWMACSGMSFEKGRQQRAPVVFGLAYVLNVVVATGLMLLVGPHRGVLVGAHAGLLAAIAFLAPGLGVIYLFESRPPALWFINAGYHLVNFTAMGAIIGLWP